MRKIALSLAVLATMLLPVLCTAPTHAQATRTWVSSTGSEIAFRSPHEAFVETLP